ncbi:hypothetical protein CFV95_020530 (plasmid) [Leptospira interrogans]|uniref:PF09926 repeat protein n=1 Tax=Leptospira interrogans TaxID=173 RepID=A0AAV9FQ42_LEPIR|nr:hypothetical protein [Leptospira interrogans]KAK2617192.1 hypothetical protein CFV95_020530 [Leptospira interrogans]WOT10909.1 hypothetical protein CFY92_0018305 [Leptospira interrogans]WOT10926.1 hypothetical protein CFY92_0018400 [Leptospira interrogans]WOT13158.1 hypothetical protein CFY92_0020070 [Leptospira interrogans]WOT13175.1 hypothetical protein CFY92_0020180 [Leptospira interrogans]
MKEGKKGYVLGEAVRDKRTGQTMYVNAVWSLEVKCVYYDPKTNQLVKLEVPYEELEKADDPFFKTRVRRDFLDLNS